MARFTLLALVAALACCGSKPSPTKQVTGSAANEPVVGGGESRASCAKAEGREVKVWITAMVTEPGDEIEMFTTLGMILTHTDPETLEAIAEANPESAEATAASAQAWSACGEKESVNCAALAEAMKATEARLGREDVWDNGAIFDRCKAGEFELEHADCALSAGAIETARTCF